MTRGLMLGSENSEFQVIVLILCPILKNGNSKFFRVNQSSGGGGGGRHFGFICTGVCGRRIGKLTHPQTKAGQKPDPFSDYLQ